jgi:lysophospholipase L1-like esterase
MRILFIGDSIIRGSQGVNFLPFLAFKHPHWEIENAGVNGQTLTCIAERIKLKLVHNTPYDAIVLEAGYNDILLPYFRKKGFLFRQALKHLLKKQYNPLSSAEAFDLKFRETIRFVQAHSSAKIILTTLGCINEDLSFYLNLQRRTYNLVIRKIARDFNLHLADVAPKFDKLLHKQNNRNYLLESFFNTAALDLFSCKYLHRADEISRARNLLLTIDGVHLNSRGAEIFMKEIEKQLLPKKQPALL